MLVLLLGAALALAAASGTASAWTITASAGANGSIAPSGAVTVPDSGSQTFTITPDPGYHLADVLVDGSSIGAQTSVSFTDVTSDHTVSASFAINTYTITATSAPHGSISPAGEVPADWGSTPTFTITADPGYTIANVRVDDVPQGPVSSYTFAPVSADHSIVASFAAAVSPATVDAVSPVGTLSPNTPTLAIPVTIRRSDTTPLMAFSVTFALSGGLTLAAGTSSITAGGFLAGGGGTTSYQVIDRGGGVYTFDGTTLGSPCGTPDSTGTLFQVTVSSAAPSGPGAVTITSVTLRDCANTGLPAAIGSAASVAIDNTGPAVTVTAPNGGEFWAVHSPQNITWTATDAAGVSGVDLAYSTDGGATYPNAIATGIANSGSYAWTVPDLSSSTVRIRVTAHDSNGNAAADASDADFTIGPFTITASAGAGGSIVPAGAVAVNYGDSASFTITAQAGQHVADVLVDGVSVGAVTGYTFRNVTANHSIAASFTANPAVPPISALAAAQVKTGNPAGGTTGIRLTWPDLPAGSIVEVFRAGFGNYPEYDDAPGAGSAPPVPAGYPPGPRWTATAVGASGQVDTPPARDVWYYVAYVTDAYGTRSPVSNRTGGTLDYHLGDVTDGVTPGNGDNHVNAADVSALGAHYGLTGAAVAPFAYLDIGPTTDYTVDGRPMTDNAIDFEDFVLFGINYDLVSAPAARVQPAPVAADELVLEAPVRVEANDAVAARLTLRGAGRLQGVSTRITWDASVLEAGEMVSGGWVESQGGMVLTRGAGTVDAVLLGVRSAGLAGEGPLATLHFRALRAGDPGFRFAAVTGRDAKNAAVPVAATERATSVVPERTRLAPVAPNPVRGAADIAYALARAGAVALEVFGVEGRRVCTLARGVQDAGEYRVCWDGRDERGGRVAAGVFYVRLTTGQGRFTERLVLLP